MQVSVGIGGSVAGHLLLSDEVRPDAAGVVAGLQKRGLKVLLLSGLSPSRDTGCYGIVCGFEKCALTFSHTLASQKSALLVVLPVVSGSAKGSI